MGDFIDNAWVELHDVDVARDALLGPRDGGYHVVMHELDTERVTYCMASLRASRRAFEVAAEYATARVQESAVTKLFVARAVCKLANDALQVLGGARYTSDLPVHGILRNSRLLRIGAGSDEIMEFLIAREVLGEIGGTPLA